VLAGSEEVRVHLRLASSGQIERDNADRDAFVAEIEQRTPSLPAKKLAAVADG
jgi:hypothetical protein